MVAIKFMIGVIAKSVSSFVYHQPCITEMTARIKLVIDLNLLKLTVTLTLALTLALTLTLTRYRPELTNPNPITL